MFRIIIGVAIFAATLFVILVRPYRVPEAVAACAGALLMLLGDFVNPGAALGALSAQWNVFRFFLGLMAISALADQAGTFDALATLTARGPLGRFQEELLAAADRWLFGDNTDVVNDTSDKTAIPITGRVRLGECPRCGAPLCLEIDASGNHLRVEGEEEG
jgi:arsenical pump membrane protein